ncbi:MAG: hypothetical protein ACI857_002182 [Arenicella sp.]|jgi:hypothetical protein
MSGLRAEPRSQIAHGQLPEAARIIDYLHSTTQSMKPIFTLLILVLSLSSFSQDTIVLNNNQKLLVKIIKVNAEDINYFKFGEEKGLSFTMSRYEIKKLVYADGKIEDWSEPIRNDIEEDPTEAIKDPKSLIIKGNKVFLEFDTDFAREADDYLKEELEMWGYWKVTDNIKDADFKMVFSIDRFFMFSKSGQVSVQTKGGHQIENSKKFWSGPNRYNGFNAKRKLAQKVVRKFLEVEFY